MQRRLSIRSDTASLFGDEDLEALPVLQSFKEECRLILNLAIPSVVAQLGWSVPSSLIASYIGRNFGPVYLDGYMLVMLTCSLCTLSLLEGVFDAIDTKMPHAFGSKKYQELQYLSIRGVILCLIILVPFILVLSICMDKILVAVGEDEDASEAALQWFRVYAFSLPFYCIFHTGATFLGAQAVMLPEVYSVLFNALISLPLLLYSLGGAFGYIGTAWAMTIYEGCQVIFLLTYCRYFPPHHPETWKPLTKHHFKQAIKKKPFTNFVWLSAGGMLATSDWIYWELLSLLIGTMGVTQLSVHTIPTQISTVLYMIQLGIGIAIALRVGTLIVQSPSDAKKLSLYGSIGSSVIFAILSWLVYIYREFLYRLFTKDEDVIAGCEEIWVLVTVFCFNQGSFTVTDGIISGLGKQWITGKLTILYLFMIGLPAFFYFALHKGGGVYTAWQCMLYPNVALNVSSIIYLFWVDWDKISAEIKEEGESDSEDDDDEEDEDDDDNSDNPDLAERMALTNGDEEFLKQYGTVETKTTVNNNGHSFDSFDDSDDDQDASRSKR